MPTRQHKDSSLLGFMPEKQTRELLTLGRPLHFKKKTCLFLEGDKGDFLYAIDKGEVLITTSSRDGKDVIVQKLGSGDIFGEIAMFGRQTRTNSAYAGRGAQLIAVESDKFLTFLDRNPALYRGIITLLCNRLRWSSKLVESIIFSDSMERLVARLIYLAEYHGRNTPIAISQGELAKMLGLSRETVNKNLRTLHKKKLLTLERKKIVIPDIEKLAHFDAQRRA